MSARTQTLVRAPALTLSSGTGELRDVVLGGLADDPRHLPSHLLYDAEGSRLFEQICKTPEYYLTRAELTIMQSCAEEMAALLGPQVLLLEYGSGSGLKTQLLLQQMSEVLAYMPVDVSESALLESLERLRSLLPGLTLLPLCADFSSGQLQLPALDPRQRCVVYFPGSTIGNFDELQAVRLLRAMREQMGQDGAALIGFDLKKDTRVLEAAYNDAAGITARFTLNLLERLNRELDADFERRQFAHRARWNEAMGRIETHIVSLRRQCVRVAGEEFRFERGEAMQVEISSKYSLADFARLAALADLRAVRSWQDQQQQFCVQYLEPV